MSAVRDLVLIGAGGLGREAAAAVDAINRLRPTWRLLGFLDDDARLHGTLVSGRSVRGPVELLAELPGAAVVVCVASPDDPDRRLRLVQRLRLPPDRFGSVLHPGAWLADSTRLGAGCLVLAGVVTTCDVVLGDHVALMPHAVLTHDDEVGDGATFAAGARVGGGVRVGEAAYLGSGSMVRQGLAVGRRAVLGMGGVLLEDLPADQIWGGVPARRLQRRQNGGACD